MAAATIILELVFMLFSASQECTDKMTTAIGQGALFLTFLATQLFQLKREARNRRWAREDAVALAHKTEQTAAELKTATTSALAKHEENVTTKIDQQTKELQKSMRTRVTDFTSRLDELLTEVERRRDSDAG